MSLILMSTNLTLTMMFIFMKHPLSAGFILLIQTVTISMMSGNLYQNFWFSYILFLIMIGGMLVLFMYMTSLASNEKFKTNMWMVLSMPITFLMAFLSMDMFKPNISVSEVSEMATNKNMEIMMSKFINFPLTMLMIFLMIYLLIAMIATVKITTFKQGSIRQMN